MAKTTKGAGATVFICDVCGYESRKWLGKCPGCEAWNTLVEQQVAPLDNARTQVFAQSFEPPVPLSSVRMQEWGRMQSGMDELDRVLGGGLVKGSAVLVAGDPGIGKSTLLMQLCAQVQRRWAVPVLYISAEESLQQLKMRADRLGVGGDIFVCAQTELEGIEAAIQEVAPRLVVVDSVQTVYRSGMMTTPGSVSQVRACAHTLVRAAKQTGAAVLMVGHVTKEGAIAGPRVLEHMVDTVLYFEGEKNHGFRILRAVKNRFGSTNEIALFEMTDAGMQEVLNPSEILLEQRPIGVAGSAVTCALEGTRPVLVEVQALLSTSAFNMPRRMATGMDLNRLMLLIAVLEKKAGLSITNQDAYINVAGGLKIVERTADLAFLCAMASSYRNVPLQSGMVILGEVGLTGEVRPVSQLQKRLSEISKLGFHTLLLPKGNLKSAAGTEGTKLVGVRTVHEALDIALSR